MTRLSIVLLAAVMVSALYLVRVQYDSRRLFTELDRATAEGVAQLALFQRRHRAGVAQRGQAAWRGWGAGAGELGEGGGGCTHRYH